MSGFRGKENKPVVLKWGQEDHITPIKRYDNRALHCMDRFKGRVNSGAKIRMQKPAGMVQGGPLVEEVSVDDSC